MSQRLGGTLPQLRLAPGQVIEDGFGSWIFPEDGSDEPTIKSFLNYVWVDVLDLNLDLKGQMADKEEFKASVKRRGYRDFISSLKAMAESVAKKEGTWVGLFEDGMSFFSSGFKKHNHILCLEVFLKPKMIVSPTHLALMRGTQ
jgi:hypothetical protein